MFSVEGFEKITSTIYGQIVREQDEATMQMIENYVEFLNEKIRSLESENKSLKNENEELRIQLNENHIPHID